MGCKAGGGAHKIGAHVQWEGGARIEWAHIKQGEGLI